jgi:hypothetical protein
MKSDVFTQDGMFTLSLFAYQCQNSEFGFKVKTLFPTLTTPPPPLIERWKEENDIETAERGFDLWTV